MPTILIAIFTVRTDLVVLVVLPFVFLLVFLSDFLSYSFSVIVFVFLFAVLSASLFGFVSIAWFPVYSLYVFFSTGRDGWLAAHLSRACTTGRAPPSFADASLARKLLQSKNKSRDRKETVWG